MSIKDITGFIVMVGGGVGGWWVRRLGGISGESTQVSCLSEICIKDITGFIVMVLGGRMVGKTVGGYFGREYTS